MLVGIVLYCDFQRSHFVGTAMAMLTDSFVTKLGGVGLPYLFGTGLCVAALDLAGRFSSRVEAWPVLADCMFGVYLIHPLLYYPWRKGFNEQSIAYPTAVFITATAIVLLAHLQNSALVRLLFGLRPRLANWKPA